MFDIGTLQQMKNIDINTIDPDTVVDARAIDIDINMPVPERIASYVKQIGNPYFVKVGKVIIKMNYPDTTTSANDCFENYMKTC